MLIDGGWLEGGNQISGTASSSPVAATVDDRRFVSGPPTSSKWAADDDNCERRWQRSPPTGGSKPNRQLGAIRGTVQLENDTVFPSDRFEYLSTCAVGLDG